MTVRLCYLAAVFCFSLDWAAGQTTPVSQTKYLRFVLMNLGSLDHTQDSADRFEQGIGRQFDLNNQEVAVVRAAGNELRATLNRLRASAKAITAGKHRLEAADLAALGRLAAERDALIEALANKILASVRPVVAARLYAADQVLSTREKRPKSAK